MVESAAHLFDHVFPEAPVRQWVLAFPFPLRFLFAVHPDALTQVPALVQRGIPTFIVQQAGLKVASGARTGAVTLIQCFGAAPNLESQGRVVCRQEHPFQDGSTHVVPGITAIKTYCKFRSSPKMRNFHPALTPAIDLSHSLGRFERFVPVLDRCGCSSCFPSKSGTATLLTADSRYRPVAVLMKPTYNLTERGIFEDSGDF